MKCIIQIGGSGNYVNHPITLDNFVQAFPDIDITGDTAPAGYAWFTRTNQSDFVSKNPITAKQTYDSNYIGSSAAGFQDNYFIRDLTSEEITAKIAQLNANKPYDSWTVNTDTLTIDPPTPRPTTPATKGSYYTWDEPTLSWVETKFPTANTGNTA